MPIHRDATNSVKILNIPIDQIDLAGVLERCREWLSGSGGHQIATVNPEFVMTSQRDEKFAHVLQNTALNIADGVGLLYVSRLLFEKKLYRVTGVELTEQLAALCGEMGKTIYLVGAGPDVAEQTAEVLKKKHPSLIIVGAEEGIAAGMPESEREAANKELIENIVSVAPDVLLVAFGAPKQDLWIARYLSQLSSVKIAVGVGGTFDYIAGVVPYAPYWIRTLGLEWLYRLATQPHRFNRIVTATIRFPLAALLNSFK